MKQKLFAIALVAVLAIAAGWNFNQSKNEVVLSDLALANIDALANPEDGDSDQKKIYRYTDTMEECTVYIGGAYAKGKVIMCWDGKDHPTCAKCRL